MLALGGPAPLRNEAMAGLPPKSTTGLILPAKTFHSARPKSAVVSWTGGDPETSRSVPGAAGGDDHANMRNSFRAAWRATTRWTRSARGSAPPLRPAGRTPGT